MTPSETFGLAFPDQAHWGLDANVRTCTGIHCWDQLDLNRAGWVRLLSILICFLLNIRQGQQLRSSMYSLEAMLSMFNVILSRFALAITLADLVSPGVYRYTRDCIKYNREYKYNRVTSSL
jgi:hypothetical protein